MHVHRIAPPRECVISDPDGRYQPTQCRTLSQVSNPNASMQQAIAGEVMAEDRIVSLINTPKLYRFELMNESHTYTWQSQGKLQS